MRILTILGTRPEAIRLSLIIPKLDKLCNHFLVHTNQNTDPNLSDIFFRDLPLRQPDHCMHIQGDSWAERSGQILKYTYNLLQSKEFDKLLILGDTDSALSAFVAKRLGVPVYHMEAGNRCFDDRVPEEVNRRVIDHSSDILMPYTQRSKENLIREGIPEHNIYVIGNPIWEVIKDRQDRVIHLPQTENKEYFLVTMHRAENVDDENTLSSLCEAILKLQQFYRIPVIVSTHPRTKDKLTKFGLMDKYVDTGVYYLDPFGFDDFLALQRHAKCVITDSGTCQEECCILHVPSITIRNTTERPETVECGANIIAGTEVDGIINAVATALSCSTNWSIPLGYKKMNVSDTVCKIILGR